MLFATIAMVMMCAGAMEKGAQATEEAKSVDVMFIHDLHSHLNAFSTVENGCLLYTSPSPRA